MRHVSLYGVVFEYMEKVTLRNVIVNQPVDKPMAWMEPLTIFIDICEVWISMNPILHYGSLTAGDILIDTIDREEVLFVIMMMAKTRWIFVGYYRLTGQQLSDKTSVQCKTAYINCYKRKLIPSIMISIIYDCLYKVLFW